MSGLGLAWNYLFLKDRYPYYFLSTDPYKKVLREDANGTYEQLKSRLCIQSMAFQDIDKFSPHCTGSILRTPYTANQNSYYLSASYNKLLASHLKSKSQGRNAERKSSRALTCALRDYYRRNMAHYLQVWAMNKILFFSCSPSPFTGKAGSIGAPIKLSPSGRGIGGEPPAPS